MIFLNAELHIILNFEIEEHSSVFFYLTNFALIIQNKFKAKKLKIRNFKVNFVHKFEKTECYIEFRMLDSRFSVIDEIDHEISTFAIFFQ